MIRKGLHYIFCAIGEIFDGEPPEKEETSTSESSDEDTKTDNY